MGSLKPIYTLVGQETRLPLSKGPLSVLRYISMKFAYFVSETRFGVEVMCNVTVELQCLCSR